MDAVVKAIGCEPVDWNYKTDCCGASLALTEQGIVDDLVTRILNDAKACGADAVAVACPCARSTSTAARPRSSRKDDDWQTIPVIFLSQLVGRAVGVSDKELGLRSTSST